MHLNRQATEGEKSEKLFLETGLTSRRLGGENGKSIGCEI